MDLRGKITWRVSKSICPDCPWNGWRASSGLGRGDQRRCQRLRIWLQRQRRPRISQRKAIRSIWDEGGWWSISRASIQVLTEWSVGVVQVVERLREHRRAVPLAHLQQGRALHNVDRLHELGARHRAHRRGADSDSKAAEHYGWFCREVSGARRRRGSELSGCQAPSKIH